MNTKLAKLIVLLFASGALAFTAWQRQVPLVAVANPCNSFVNELAPAVTPLLRKGGQGLEFLVTMTSVRTAESSQILAAVQWHRATLVVDPRRGRIGIAGLDEQGHLIIPVPSNEKADQVLGVLCLGVGSSQRHS